MSHALFAVWLLGAYLAGSVPFGFLVARAVAGIDIRDHGSKNVGATNVFRVVGRPWGLLVLFLDAMKGFAAVSIPSWSGTAGVPFYVLLALGVTAILGHSFPVWLNLRGGKGVATSLGVFLGIVFWPTLTAFLIFMLVFALTRIISVSSLAAVSSFPLLLFAAYRDHEQFILMLATSSVLWIFIVFTHRANIRRLLKGEEKRLF